MSEIEVRPSLLNLTCSCNSYLLSAVFRALFGSVREVLRVNSTNDPLPARTEICRLERDVEVL